MSQKKKWINFYPPHLTQSGLSVGWWLMVMLERVNSPELLGKNRLN